MSETKLTSDEVPTKFADWLLAMGCPPEKVPAVDKIAQMCRGTYYLVWRSLMEQVESKDVIKQKRLQVFADDVRRCKKKNLFTDHDTNVLIPPELTLWRQQTVVRQKVLEAERRVTEARTELNEVMDKVSSKMSQRNLSRQRVQDLQRRGWLLQLLAEELRAKNTSLAETRAIAEDMCAVHDQTDVQKKEEEALCAGQIRSATPPIQTSTKRYILPRTGQNGKMSSGNSNEEYDTRRRRMFEKSTIHASTISAIQVKLDRCLSSQLRQPAAVASSTMMSTTSSGELDEEQISQLSQCRGDALWAELYSRRAALVSSLSGKGDVAVEKDRLSFQTVLTETAALQCTLTLEALKCREMSRLAQQRLAQAVDTLNTQLSSESCELLVLRCERARTEARVNSLRELLQQVTAREGLFATSRMEDSRPAMAMIHRIDKAIESKRDEIKSVISSLATTERKIQNARECLAAIFNGFRSDTPVGDINSGRGLQLDLPQDSIASLRQFYERRRERSKMELSMEFDVTENSFNDISDLSNARFIDELRIYLKKFNLEKNRKLVLESGEKIWIFETLQSAGHRLHARWQACDATSGITCPSQSLSYSILTLASAARDRGRLRDYKLGAGDFRVAVDVTNHANKEDQIIDKLKKLLDENLRSLSKTSKTLDQGRENLTLWSSNQFKNHISQLRTVDGKPYRAYEAYYLEALSF